MEADVELAARQLARMRGMNAAYHRRFFGDVRFVLVVVLLLFAGGLELDRHLYLAIPFVALFGATQTAFDASYLVFSRHYSARLEQYLNRRVGRDVLVAHRMEETYLFPLDTRKIVTLAGGSGFTWFGFMTGLITLMGIGAYVTGLLLSLDVLTDRGSVVLAGTYLGVLLGLTILALAVGAWWFVGGEGERRLSAVLDDAFGN